MSQNEGAKSSVPGPQFTDTLGRVQPTLAFPNDVKDWTAMPWKPKLPHNTMTEAWVAVLPRRHALASCVTFSESSLSNSERRALVARAIRNAIRANRFARIIRN